MREDQRQAVRDNARYLREVRPIDPEEIHEYVPDQPHPAAVRQALREAAFNLGLVERPDGTFEPVEPGPIEVAFEGIETVPESHLRTIEDRLVARFGPDWHRGDSGAALRERVRDIKERYLTGAPVEYDERTALGYAIYHFPQAYATAQHVVAELAAADLLPRQLRVLDVGAGVGGPAMGLFDLLPDDALLDYHAVEPSAATAVLEPLLEDAGRNLHTTVHEVPVQEFLTEGGLAEPADVILCANVLSELTEPAAVAEQLLDGLEPGGTFVGIAPADRNTATGLREVERSLVEERDATVYAPTVRLWPHVEPAGECWSFLRQPPLSVPYLQARLDEAGADDGEFLNTDVQYAYSLVRTDGETAIDFRPDDSRYARMADAEDTVTDRIDCVGIKLSQDLAADPTADGSHEGNPLFLVGDGSEQVDHFAVLTESSVLNEDLTEAAYGDALRFENVLVLWNDDEAAYNLVVDGETVVESVERA